MVKQNYSRKREAILKAIQSTKIHPTAEWIYQQIKAQYPDLSLGTVYRNLARFKEDGVIVSVGVVNGQERFDADITPHVHFICKSCNAVLDLEGTFAGELDYRSIEKENNVLVDSHELTFYGKCHDCVSKRL